MCQPTALPQGDAKFWRPDDDTDDVQGTGAPIHRPDVYGMIERRISELDEELRALSLDIHDHPELKFEEHRTHDVLTKFLTKHGWDVTPHYLLETAWFAKFTRGKGGRTLGINSEMDALPGIGHACGHNLIAISGVAVACAVRSVLEELDIPGTVVLLGTPAEEGGYGKVRLLEKGGYEGMDACLMCHPSPGPALSASLSSTLAINQLTVEYHGHTAHAALAPWEGQNALDAVVSAYTNISLLRQQLKPTYRVHAAISGRDWAANIIPDYSKMQYLVRAPTTAEVLETVPRVKACLDAAALATACKAEYDYSGVPLNEVRQNKALGDEFASVFASKYGAVDYVYGIANASTDFGNITYALPSIHPSFAIPTEEGGTNHTRAFAKSAATPEAHKACLNISKALAAVGVRVLTDDEFFAKVKKTFEDESKAAQASLAAV
ncbi:aminoacylase 1-like protein 2 [Cytidiella melzeri]|nr:aminoacylase 1-like protein 2 [Cytidiella melzeri]